MVEIIDIVYASVPLIGFLSLLVWHGAHQVSAIMAVILVLMAPVVYFIVHAEKFDEYWVKREAAKPAELYVEDTIVVIIAKVRLYSESKKDMRPFLKTLRERIHRGLYDSVELVHMGLVRTAVNALDNSPDFLLNTLSLVDIINELLMIPAARKAFQNTPDDAKTCVCVASKLLRSALNKQAPTNAAWDVINEKELESLLYKLMIAIGMMCEENNILQFVSVDENCIAMILEAIYLFPKSKHLAKWACWSLINLTMNHPPNRHEFVDNGGIPKVMKLLQIHGTDDNIQLQGAGLFLNIFVEDAYSNYSVPRARESALANGLGVLLQDNIQNFPKNNKLVAVCRKLQNSLITMWT